MSKIWVNGEEIDLALLTPEEISALTHSENLDYIHPDGLYYADSISGDGSFDQPYGVTKVDNPLVISVYGEDGKVSTKSYDGSKLTEVRIDDYRSVVDNNTIDGNGTVASPFKVSDNLLTAIDSAYTMSIQTVQVIDDLEELVEYVLTFHDEVSAKCDYAIAVAESANVISLKAELIAMSAMSAVTKNEEDIDKLYEFISTLIYDIEFDEDSNSLKLTYVDGSVSYVKLTKLDIIEQNLNELSAFTMQLADAFNQLVIDLKDVVIDVQYDRDNSSLIIVYLDGSTKTIVLEDVKEMKQEIINMNSAITINTNNITNINNILNIFSADINTLYDDVDILSEATQGNIDDIQELSAKATPVIAKFPSAINNIDYAYTIDESGETSGDIHDYIIYTDFSGNTNEIPLVGIDDKLNDLQDQINSGVSDITYLSGDNIIMVHYFNLPDKAINLNVQDANVPKTKVYFELAEGVSATTVMINGEEHNVFASPNNFVQLTGNAVNISENSNPDITAINFNGLILDSNSELSGNPNLTKIENIILPSNGSQMFADDTSLLSVDVNSDLLINGENMFSGCTSLTDFDSNLKTLIIAPNMFYDCSKLTGFSTDMPMLREGQYMFYNCESIQYLNNLNLSRLEDGTAMFADCDILETVEKIQLNKLYNGTNMFSGSTALRTSSIQTPNLISGDYMFYKNSFKGYNGPLSKLITADYMFAENKALTSVTITDLSSLKYANKMFSNCTGIKTISLPNKINNLEEAEYMFENCEKITQFTPTTTNLVKANYMFYGCTRLSAFTQTSLPLLAEGEHMFENCQALKTIRCDVASLGKASHIFDGCTALTTIELSNVQCSIDFAETNIDEESISYIANHINKPTVKQTITFSTAIEGTIEQAVIDKFEANNFEVVYR